MTAEELAYWRSQPGVAVAMPVHDVAKDTRWVDLYIGPDADPPHVEGPALVWRLTNWSPILVRWTVQARGWWSGVAMGSNLDTRDEVLADPDMAEPEIRHLLMAWHKKQEARASKQLLEGWDVFVRHVRDLTFAHAPETLWHPTIHNLIVRRGEPITYLHIVPAVDPKTR